MSEERKLPAPDFCNREGGGKANPVYGKGALGNQYSGRMYYAGSPDEKERWVTLAQEMLIALGYDVGPKGADGKFGNDTEKAVQKFQEAHEDWGGEKLNVDGLIGPETSDALNRGMVGVEGWHDRHQTEKKLTITFSLLTVTSEALKKEVPFDVADTENGRVVVVGDIPEQTHPVSEFFILYPALGLPDAVTDGTVTALLLFSKDSWVLGTGGSDEEWRGVRDAIADKLGYSAWDKKDSDAGTVPVKPDEISDLAWLTVQYTGVRSGNNGKITDMRGDRTRELVVAQHAMDHLASGAGLSIHKVLRIRIAPDGISDGLYTLCNKTDESGFVRKALADITVPGNPPREPESEMKTLISRSPVRLYHPFFLSVKESLDIGHVTDVHVATRHDLYERILGNRVSGFNNYNRSFEEVIKGASSRADIVVLTGDMIDYNRGHKIDLAKNDGNTYENERDFARDYIFNRNWVLFYELLVNNYKKPVFTVLGNHEYLLNPFKPDIGITVTLIGIPIVHRTFPSGVTDMNLKEDELSFEPPAEFTVGSGDASQFIALMGEHNEAGLAPIIRRLAGSQIDDPRTGFWYATWESVTWYLLVINPFTDYWFTVGNVSILMLDWSEKQNTGGARLQNEGALLLLPRPTGCISQYQFRLMDTWLEQKVQTNIFCSHAPVCDPWDDLGNYYLEKAVLKRNHDDESDYSAETQRVRRESRQLNLGAVEENSRLKLLSEYIFSSPPRIQVALSGHSHTNRIFQQVIMNGEKRLVLKREEKPESWDPGSPFVIVTNSGGNTGRTNEVAEWADIIPPGYRILKFDSAGKMKAESQVFFSSRIQIRSEVQQDGIKNDPGFSVPVNPHDIWRFPPPSGTPVFTSAVSLNPDVSAVIDRVAHAATIENLNDGRAIAIKRIEQQGSLSVGLIANEFQANDGTIVIEENRGTLDINNNDDLLVVDCNHGLIRANKNDDRVLVHVNHGAVDVTNNGWGQGGTDLIKIFDNHGTVTLNPPHGNEDLIIIKRNHENGTITVNYNNDTLNIATNRGTLNINSNEGGPLEKNSTINILDNKGGTINIRNNRGDVNICQEDQGTVNLLENSGNVNARSRQWLKDEYRFD